MEPTNESSKKTPWDYLRKFLFDLVPVVVGILIALAVDEWAQDRREQSQVQRILAGIARDYELIDSSTTKLLPRHKRLLELLTSIHGRDSISVISIIQEAKGITTPSVRRPSDLEMLGPTAREHLSYELLAVIGEIEQDFELLIQRETVMQSLAYSSRMYLKGKESVTEKANFSVLISDLIGTEEEMLHDLAKFRDVLKKK